MRLAREKIESLEVSAMESRIFKVGKGCWSVDSTKGKNGLKNGERKRLGIKGYRINIQKIQAVMIKDVALKYGILKMLNAIPKRIQSGNKESGT